ncbi:hypothetical protein Hanom_Chr08g00717541 [Helianthus anomalus]
MHRKTIKNNKQTNKQTIISYLVLMMPCIGTTNRQTMQKLRISKKVEFSICTSYPILQYRVCRGPHIHFLVRVSSY